MPAQGPFNTWAHVAIVNKILRSPEHNDKGDLATGDEVWKIVG